MLRNYFKIAWRSIFKNRFYSLVNIIGLSTGIAFALLMAAYVWSEVEINQSLTHPEQIYLLENQWKKGNEGSAFKTIAPLAVALKQQYPNLVSNYYRWDWVSTIVSKGDKHFRDSMQIGDTTLVSLFGFPLLYGNKHNLFSQADAVVITESKAMKYFGKTDVVGETLTIENYAGKHKDFMITGVLKDLPENSASLSLIPINTTANATFISMNNLSFFYKGADIESWESTQLTGYVALQKGVTAAALEQPIKQLLKANAPDYITENLTVHPACLATYHLDVNNGLVRKMLWTLSLIALFILLMAVVNFINITIGSSSSRLKEIGVRKVLGGLRKQLVAQFLAESFLLTITAVLVALCIYHFASPYFAQVVGKELPSLFSFPASFSIIPFLLIVVIGFLAGIYPALVLSSLPSISALKRQVTSVNENVFIKRLLTGFQFAIAIIVFAGAIVITQQVSYFFNTDLGFDKDQLINVTLPRNWTDEGVKNMETIRNELSTLPGVASVSLCYSIPNRNIDNFTDLYRQEKDSANAIPFFTFITDEKYAATFGIPLAAGQFFSDKAPNDSSSDVVINETAVKRLGWKSADDAIGNTLRGADSTVYTIRGVVKDYHFETKKESIRPLVFFYVRDWNAYRFLSFRLQSKNMQSTISNIQKQMAVLLPSAPFEYSFMDETIHRAYLTETHLENAAYTATVIAVIIVMLGIIGVVSLSITKRTKEVGIRKVLGASVSNIVALFIKEFVPVVIVANCIALPVAFLILNNWLHQYAYRIAINPLVFIVVAIILMIVAIVLISLQTAKAVIANPVKSLRSE